MKLLLYCSNNVNETRGNNFIAGNMNLPCSLLQDARAKHFY